MNLYTEVRPYNDFEITDEVKALILSDSIFMLSDHIKPDIRLESLLSHCPVLGIGFGAQYILSYLGGEVEITEPETGNANMTILRTEDPIMEGIAPKSQVVKTRQGRIINLPDDFDTLAEYEGGELADRKSTRLNSSHVAISYAVFCLKKKKV